MLFAFKFLDYKSALVIILNTVFTQKNPTNLSWPYHIISQPPQQTSYPETQGCFSNLESRYTISQRLANRSQKCHSKKKMLLRTRVVMNSNLTNEIASTN